MYSAAGEWIYYSSMIDGSYSIYRIKPDGSSRTQITWAQKGEEDARVYVSLTGRLMIYNKRVGETIEIRQCTL
jgi:Tol biopolymer transport system component